VRVLAARFPDPRRASAALDALRGCLALADDDAAIAPLGTPGAGDEGEETLLAGRFRENQVALVHSTVTHAGGDVVADVDELWTRPRAPADESDLADRPTGLA
jgi:hypothetical protein